MINQITVNSNLTERLGIPLTDSRADIEEPLEYTKALLKEFDLLNLNLKKSWKTREVEL